MSLKLSLKIQLRVSPTKKDNKSIPSRQGHKAKTGQGGWEEAKSQ